MTCFVDTSALYAVLDAGDRYHARAARNWETLIEEDTPLFVTNYVLLETTALLQSRLGLEAVKVFNHEILPMLEVWWVGESDHLTAVEVLLLSGKKGLSLVDCVSFRVMREQGIDSAFAFDRHFQEQGFKVIT